MTGRSFGQQWDDKTISTQVKTKLSFDRGLNLFSTGVGTQFGVVRLTGTVHSPEQKAEAERIASRVAGVRGVKNEIVVVPREQPPTKAAEAAPAASPVPAASTAPASPPPAASPATMRPLTVTGQVVAINPTSGDVTVRTDAGGGDVVLRFPTATARQLEQGQRISINAGTK